MSETVHQPLLYRMGVIVGQSIAAAKTQVQQEVHQELDQAVTQVTGDYDALARKVRLMRLNNLLGLGI